MKILKVFAALTFLTLLGCSQSKSPDSANDSPPTNSSGRTCLYYGNSVLPGATVSGFLASTAMYNVGCKPVVATCDGTTGNLTMNPVPFCQVEYYRTCSFKGQTYQPGDMVTGFEKATVPFGETCKTVTSLCSQETGEFSGVTESCEVLPPVACRLGEVEVPNGESIVAYESISDKLCEEVSSEVRTCSNGVLSGSYPNTECINPPHAEFKIFIAADNLSVTLNIKPATSGGLVRVYWDDGVIRDLPTNSNNGISHSYVNSQGEKTIKVLGLFDKLPDDRPLILPGVNFTEVVKWGPSKFVNLSYMFKSSGVSKIPVDEVPDFSLATKMDYMFSGATGFNQPLNFNTENITSMRGMFASASNFNQPLNLNTTNVTNMREMFANTLKFNQPLNFNTTSVTTMREMFSGTREFNQELNFDTKNVTDMTGMFLGARDFNSALNFTDTSWVVDMTGMFAGTINFNQPLNFNTSSVRFMSSMFEYARKFNSPLNFTDTSRVISFTLMFSRSLEFNQQLHFNTSGAWYMNSMFYDALKYNQPINFDGTNLSTLTNFLKGAVLFNSPVNITNTTKLESTLGMFSGTQFNLPFSLNTESVIDMSFMFYGTPFNQEVNFNTKSAKFMNHMFANSSFNKGVNFITDRVQNFNAMFSNSNFSGPLNFTYTGSAVNMDLMFMGTNFKGDISSWCVLEILTKPVDFDLNTPIDWEESKKPRWGQACFLP